MHARRPTNGSALPWYRAPHILLSYTSEAGISIYQYKRYLELLVDAVPRPVVVSTAVFREQGFRGVVGSTCIHRNEC